MNYGYGRGTRNWKRERQRKLASELGKIWGDVEVDGLYEGVRLRRITHLSDEDRTKLIQKADEIYAEVMKE